MRFDAHQQTRVTRYLRDNASEREINQRIARYAIRGAVGEVAQASR
jgi:hypothetical protein